MLRRARMLAVLGFLLAGGIGVISSTQTWITVRRTDAAEPVLVAGADVFALLAPLSLAVLALGAALSIAGRVPRYLFAVLGAGGALALTAGTLPIVLGPPLEAVGPALTEVTGLTGDDTLAAMVSGLDATAWPVIALCAWGLLLLATVLVLCTAHRWRSGGRRYRQSTAGGHAATGRLDPVDSWDELSHGTDPTGPSR